MDSTVGENLCDMLGVYMCYICAQHALLALEMCRGEIHNMLAEIIESNILGIQLKFYEYLTLTGGGAPDSKMSSA